MNYKLAAGVLLVAVCVSLETRAQSPGDFDADGKPEGIRPMEAPPTPAGAEELAEDLRLKGKCEQAIPIFRSLAQKGSGFEVSQFNLGLCLFDVGLATPNGQQAASLKHEAAEWVLKAANSGFARAQSRLVAVYLDGNGEDVDPVEAGKWSLIYHQNASRFAFGLPDISSDLQERLNSTMTEKTWAEAKARAAKWSPPPPNDYGVQ